MQSPGASSFDFPVVPGAGDRVAYLGLGANLGDREGALRAAIRLLVDRNALFDSRVSSFFETDAVSEFPQPHYLNAVIRGQTRLDPRQLLAVCLDVESLLGRQRPVGVQKAARTIDIDVLLVADVVLNEADLVIPHPQLLNRSFVRIPLAEVAASGLVHPITRESLDVAAPDAAVRRWST